MSAEENKAIMLRGVETSEKRGYEARFSMFDSACVFPDLVAYGLPPTLEGFHQLMATAREAFSDISTTVEEIVAEGETVMLWGMDRAIHTGTWCHVPATNKRVSFRVFVCAHFAHGKVVEYRFLNDEMSFLQQVGALP